MRREDPHQWKIFSSSCVKCATSTEREWFAEPHVGFLSNFQQFLLWLCAIHWCKLIWNLYRTFTFGGFPPVLNNVVFFFCFFCNCSRTENSHTAPPTTKKIKDSFKKHPRGAKLSQITSAATYLIDLFTTPGFNKRHQSAGYWSI